jgi:hypothetical protein
LTKFDNPARDETFDPGILVQRSLPSSTDAPRTPPSRRNEAKKAAVHDLSAVFKAQARAQILRPEILFNQLPRNNAK